MRVAAFLPVLPIALPTGTSQSSLRTGVRRSRPATKRLLIRLTAAGSGSAARPSGGSAGGGGSAESFPRRARADDATSSSSAEAESLSELQRLADAGVSSNPASLQVDDGSLAAEVTFLPRKLVLKKSRRKRLSLATARERLLAGFDEGIGAVVLLLFLFGIWYASNTIFNVYNKQVLRVFPFPLTCTVAQFFVAAFSMATLWLLRIKKAPVMNSFSLKAVLPLAVCHAAGFLLTNMSLGKVSVAFTHTVKSTEPFFSVALTPGILGDIPTWGILGALFPIVGGVALASATEVSFNWIGFLSAVGSNVALQSRNVLSKKLMKAQAAEPLPRRNNPNNGPERATLSPEVIAAAERKREKEEEALISLDNINLFSAMTILALLLLAPLAYMWEGFPLLSSAAAPATTGMSMLRLIYMIAIGGICRCADVLSSYMILKRVSPVTHSVGNCVKRAVVIAVSIVFFKTTMTPLNVFGTVLALSGVLLYSLIVAACKQNTFFGPESPVCKPIYEPELELVEGGGI